MTMEMHKLFGVICLGVLMVLCLHSFSETPKHWQELPPLDYVIKNIEDFDNVVVHVDGTVSEVNNNDGVTRFFLSLDPARIFGGINVEAKAVDIKENEVVHARGIVKKGVLIVDEVAATKYPVYFELFFNILGFALFISLSLREWKLKKDFPFIEVR